MQPPMRRISRRDACRGIAAGFGLTLLAGCATGESARRRREFRDREPLQDMPVATDLDWRPHAPELGSTSSVPVPAPSGIIPRSAWTRESPRVYLADPMVGISRITVHHDGMDPFTSSSRADAVDRLELIRRSHVNKGWADIGYHFVIDPAGRIYEARPLALQGAHVKDNNEHNLGVMMLGNFDRQSPTPAAAAALAAFVRGQMARYSVDHRRVYTHQELRPTACPGTSLQSYMIAQRGRGGSLA